LSRAIGVVAGGITSEASTSAAHGSSSSCPATSGATSGARIPPEACALIAEPTPYRSQGALQHRPGPDAAR
jgi:hypothetical protein